MSELIMTKPKMDFKARELHCTKSCCQPEYFDPGNA